MSGTVENGHYVPGPDPVRSGWRRLGPWLVVAVLVVVGLGLAYALWISLIKDYPKVTSVGEARIVGSDTVKRGDDLTFIRASECLPAGRTEMTRTLVPVKPLVKDGVEVIESPEIAAFTIDASGPVCFAPSLVVVTIPYDVKPGAYRIRRDTATDTPSLWKSVFTTWSPEFTVTR